MRNDCSWIRNFDSSPSFAKVKLVRLVLAALRLHLLLLVFRGIHGGMLSRTTIRPRSFLRVLFTAAVLCLGLSACKKESDQAQSGAAESMKIKVGYIGITCEAPIFRRSKKDFSRKKDWTSDW